MAIKDFWTTNLNPITMECSDRLSKYSERISKSSKEGMFQEIDFSTTTDCSAIKIAINNNKYEQVIQLIS